MEVSTEILYNRENEKQLLLASPSGGGVAAVYRRDGEGLCETDTLSVMASWEIGHDSSPRGGAKREIEVIILCLKSTSSPRMWRI